MTYILSPCFMFNNNEAICVENVLWEIDPECVSWFYGFDDGYALTELIIKIHLTMELVMTGLPYGF